MARRVAYRKKRQNRFGMFMALTVVMLILVVVAVKSIELTEKLDYYRQQEEELKAEIAEEEERALEIEEYEKYTQTKMYIEEVARDKLGLVYEGEILFKDENN